MTIPAESLPLRPVPPEPGECCGGGCARCVFDLYEEELARWERAVAELESGRDAAKNRNPQ
jgi:hypothetical protein